MCAKKTITSTFLLLSLVGLGVAGLGSPQGQPQAGSPSTPGPASNGTHTITITSSGKHRNRGWRDWRKDDPTRHNSLWKSVTPLGEQRPPRNKVSFPLRFK